MPPEIVYKAGRLWNNAVQKLNIDLLQFFPVSPRKAAPPPVGDKRVYDKQAALGEIGVTGLQSFSGKIRQEYTSDLLTLESRMTHFEEMRRSEPAIAVMEALIRLPITAAQFTIQPGDNKELSARIEQNLFGGEMTHTFSHLLRTALLAVLYGFTCHEKVFEFKGDGFFGWRKFAERDRKSVYQWQFDEVGEVLGIVQRGVNPGSGVWCTQSIPIDKLMLWSWRKEIGDPEGLGALRQAYKPYKIKQALEEFAGIRVERQACGVPVAIAPEFSEKTPELMKVDEDTARVFVQRLRTAEDAGGVFPFGWNFQMLDMGAADVPFLPLIEWNHQMMLQSILAQFIGLGGNKGGSFGMSEDQSGLFLMSLVAIADWFCEYFNQYAIPQLCYFNEPNPGKLPELKHGAIGIRDTRGFAQTLRLLYGPNAQIPSSIVHYVLEEFGVVLSEELEKEEAEIEEQAAKAATLAAAPRAASSQQSGGAAVNTGAGGATAGARASDAGDAEGA
jgi:hypothetical protein